MTSPTVPITVGPNTHLRSGVSHVNPVDNVIAILPEGPYAAEVQCTGESVTEAGATNNWWVRVTVDGRTGWISGVTVLEGVDNQEIPGVPKVATVNV